MDKYFSMIGNLKREDRATYPLFFLCARQGRTYLEVQVLYRPDRGDCQPEGKGVRREVESEESRR
jgi:hypothetical protein